MTVQPTCLEATCTNIICSPLGAAIGGCAGYLGAYCFTTINPVIGAIYGASSLVIHSLILPLFQSLSCNNGICQFAAHLVSLGVAAVLAQNAVALAGIALTNPQVAVLTLSAAAISALVFFVFPRCK